MAKMTKAGIAAFAASYVASASIATTYSASTDNLYGLVDKIGKLVSIKGVFNDKLPEMDGDDLPFGKTIEEYMIDLVLPTVYGTNGLQTETNATTEGAKDIVPAYPSVEAAAYSYPLGTIKHKTTQPWQYVQSAVYDAEQFGKLTSDILWSFENSRSLTKYTIKKQLLGTAITKAITASLVKVIDKPVDTLTSEAFIKQVKDDVENASFASENTSLGGALIGAAEELTLYVKKGVMSAVEVDALAGAFHEERLAIPANVKVVDDFGSADAKVFAVLVDPRGIKLHNNYRAIRSAENADGDFVNFVSHENYTGFISKHTFIKVYETA